MSEVLTLDNHKLSIRKLVLYNDNAILGQNKVLENELVIRTRCFFSMFSLRLLVAIFYDRKFLIPSCAAVDGDVVTRAKLFNPCVSMIDLTLLVVLVISN